MANKKSFSQLFTEARDAGKGIFEYNGKQYSTLKKGEDEAAFRKAHQDYDDFMGNLGHTDSKFYNHNDGTYGGWAIKDPVEVSHKVNLVPAAIPTPTSTQPVEKITLPQNPSAFTDDDIRSLGFRNYSGLVSAVSNPNNSNNNFVKALVARFGQPNTWDQNTVEGALGVKGNYRTFGAGDFGDMSRSMANYMKQGSGKTYDRTQVRAYMRENNLNPYDYTGAERRALRYYLNGDTTGEGYDINLLKGSQLGNSLKLKFQQGGKMDEQQLQQAFIQYLAQKTGAKNQQELEAVIQQLGEEGLKKAYAEFIQQLQQQQVQAAKFGAKLNYIRTLRGQCPEGYDMQYYKAGGQLCKKCMKKHAQQKEAPADPIDAFKCGRKMKKAQQGAKVQKKYPLYDEKNGKRTVKYYNDEATRDSIAANRYNDQEVLDTKPGSLKKNKQGKVVWAPDRTKAPYKR